MKRMVVMASDLSKAQEEWKAQLNNAASRNDPKKETVSFRLNEL